MNFTYLFDSEDMLDTLKASWDADPEDYVRQMSLLAFVLTENLSSYLIKPAE